MFTRLVDKEPTNTSFQTSDTMTKVNIKDFDPVRHVNFEAEIFAPLDDQANWVENYILAYVITIPGAWLAINLLAMGIFVVWLTRYMGKLEEKTFGAYTGKFTIDKVCRSRKKLNEFVKKRSKSKCGYQWSDANNGKKKLCWEESDNKVFGPGNTCTFIMNVSHVTMFHVALCMLPLGHVVC